jgi:hypothetical protein
MKAFLGSRLLSWSHLLPGGWLNRESKISKQSLPSNGLKIAIRTSNPNLISYAHQLKGNTPGETVSISQKACEDGKGSSVYISATEGGAGILGAGRYFQVTGFGEAANASVGGLSTDFTVENRTGLIRALRSDLTEAGFTIGPVQKHAWVLDAFGNPAKKGEKEIESLEVDTKDFDRISPNEGFDTGLSNDLKIICNSNDSSIINFSMVPCATSRYKSDSPKQVTVFNYNSFRDSNPPDSGREYLVDPTSVTKITLLGWKPDLDMGTLDTSNLDLTVDGILTALNEAGIPFEISGSGYLHRAKDREDKFGIFDRPSAHEQLIKLVQSAD